MALLFLPTEAACKMDASLLIYKLWLTFAVYSRPRKARRERSVSVDML